MKNEDSTTKNTKFHKKMEQIDLYIFYNMKL
jgi:hypothetical protein